MVDQQVILQNHARQNVFDQWRLHRHMQLKGMRGDVDKLSQF